MPQAEMTGDITGPACPMQRGQLLLSKFFDINNFYAYYKSICKDFVYLCILLACCCHLGNLSNALNLALSPDIPV